MKNPAVNEKALQSLQKIKGYAQKEHLGACYSIFAPAYYDPSTNTYCAIGCLMPEPIRKYLINKFGLNEARILWKIFPELEKNTGIAAEEAQLIQELNDKLWREEFHSLSLRDFPTILDFIIHAGKINHSVIKQALYEAYRNKEKQSQANTSRKKTSKCNFQALQLY